MATQRKNASVKKSTVRKSAVSKSPVKKPVAKKRVDVDADSVVAWLKRTGTKRERDGMARFGLPSDKAFGVSVGTMQRYAKEIGQNHDLSLALWDTGVVRSEDDGGVRGRSRPCHSRSDGSVVQGLRQLGHRRHGVLQAVRSNSPRMEQGRSMEPAGRGVRQTRRIRPSGVSRAPRQGCQ